MDCIVKDILLQFPYLKAMDLYIAVMREKTLQFPLLYLGNNEVVYPEEYDDGTWVFYGKINSF